MTRLLLTEPCRRHHGCPGFPGVPDVEVVVEIGQNLPGGSPRPRAGV